MVRIKSSLPEFSSDPEVGSKAQFVMTALLANINKIDEDVTKKIVYIVLLAVTFEFMKRASIKQVSLLGVEFTDLGTVEKLIPLVVAYLFLSCWALIASRRLMEDVFDSIVEIVFPALWKDDIEGYLRPPNFVKTHDLVAREINGVLSEAIRASMVPVIVVLGLSAPLFLIYAYYSLFERHGPDIVCIVTSVISGFFLLQSIFLIGAVNRATHSMPSTAGVEESPTPESNER